MGRLDGKVAVITGAGGGMGREAAILFTEEGARVCVADVDRQAAEETVSLCPGEAFSVEVDVADEEGVAALYAETSERFGGVDVLYNNAGISPGDDASVLETSVEAWQRVQDINAKGVFLCCKHGIPHLLKRGEGSVINVASFVAIVGAATSQISYTASKGAVHTMAASLALEFAAFGARVVAIARANGGFVLSSQTEGSSTGTLMNISKDQIVQLLGSRGNHGKAQQASQQLPDQVDTDNGQHADLLSKLGLDTGSLGNQLGGLGKIL